MANPSNLWCSTELRDYQREMLERLRRAWRGARSVMVQMPTGTGKTHLLAAVIQEENSLPPAVTSGSPEGGLGGVLVVAHRRELIGQISGTLSSFGIAHGVIISGRAVDASKRVQVASIQTLVRRLGEADVWGDTDDTGATGGTEYSEGSECSEFSGNAEAVDSTEGKASSGDSSAFSPSLIIIDEAHHAVAKTYRGLWEWWPQARFLGLTATPCRLSGRGFGDLFDVLLQSHTIGKFISMGWLSDFDYVSASPESMALRRIASLRKRGADGDYQTREMAMVMDVPESVEHLYNTYRAFARGRKGIVYAISREHAQHIAAYYQRQGVSCCVIDCKTPAEERERLIRRFTPSATPKEGENERREIDVIVNVDIFSEGFDCPEVEFIQLARPTLSLSKYLQQVGRGMRVARGKDHVLILDNVGLYQTFGLPTDDRDWEEYFLGEASGRGSALRSVPVIIRDGDADERELVNLEMVRIRRRSEKAEGLAVYLQDGRYGVMRDGRPTTQAVFEHIERCCEGPFYAYGIYPYQCYQSRKTVIDRNGTDLGVQLYGRVELRGEFLYGQGIGGSLVVWDTVGRRYFQGEAPKFERVGWLDLLRVGGGEYELRYGRGLNLFRFRKEDVLFNQHIAIVRDKLIVRGEGQRVFTIFGYWGDKVLVCGKKQCSTIPVSWNGKMGAYQDIFPSDYSFHPDYALLRLKTSSGAVPFAGQRRQRASVAYR